MPRRRRLSVVLPLPLSPTMPIVSPDLTVRLTPSSALVPARDPDLRGNCLWTSRASRITSTLAVTTADRGRHSSTRHPLGRFVAVGDYWRDTWLLPAGSGVQMDSPFARPQQMGAALGWLV